VAPTWTWPNKTREGEHREDNSTPPSAASAPKHLGTITFEWNPAKMTTHAYLARAGPAAAAAAADAAARRRAAGTQTGEWSGDKKAGEWSGDKNKVVMQVGLLARLTARVFLDKTLSPQGVMSAAVHAPRDVLSFLS
jgi:hypothetical protein